MVIKWNLNSGFNHILSQQIIWERIERFPVGWGEGCWQSAAGTATSGHAEAHGPTSVPKHLQDYLSSRVRKWRMIQSYWDCLNLRTQEDGGGI